MAIHRLAAAPPAVAAISVATCLAPTVLGMAILTTPKPRVAIVGGGLSGLVVGHVLSHSGMYEVELFEKEVVVGGNVRSMVDPLSASGKDMLNIGHATHLGMFWNLRLMLKHLGVKEWPVGRGRNDEPGLFRMLSVDPRGTTIQPPLEDLLCLKTWLEAFVFYVCSYIEPERRLDEFLETRNFSDRFLGILYWAMATFEFDKAVDEAGEYALGAARALLITQVFFKFILCDKFEGRLPPKIDSGLKDELFARIRKHTPKDVADKLLQRLESDAQVMNAPLASYFTADYSLAMEKLASIIGDVKKEAVVSCVKKHEGSGRILVQTEDGYTAEVDSVVFTTQPSSIANILTTADFSPHVEALNSIESGGVGVQIIHETDLPFQYPPRRYSPSKTFGLSDPPRILGIFDISELTISKNLGVQKSQRVKLYEDKQSGGNTAGWLSIAYPVYGDTSLNRHKAFLKPVPCADETIYPWTRATACYPHVRRTLVSLQGHNGVYITGHTMTGVNKASELQITNALVLCYTYFDALPPWGPFASTPLLPDCNDDDAFEKAQSPFEAVRLAWKSLVGSFLLVGVVSKLGVEVFD